MTSTDFVNCIVLWTEEVTGMAGQWARRPRTTSGRMFPLAAACSRLTPQLQIRPAYGLDGRAVMLIDRYDGRRRRPRRSR